MIYVRNYLIDLKEIIFDYSVKHFPTPMSLNLKRSLHRLDGYAVFFSGTKSIRLVDRFHCTKYDFGASRCKEIKEYNSGATDDIL